MKALSELACEALSMLYHIQMEKKIPKYLQMGVMLPIYKKVNCQ